MVSCSVSSPGKVILFGEHAVVYGKAAVAVSLGLRTRLHIASSSDKSTIQLTVNQLDLNQIWKLDDVLRTLSIAVDAKQPREPHHEDLNRIEQFLLSNSSVDDNSCNLLLITFLYLFTSILDKDSCSKNAGLRFDVDTDLPIGAGVGSSASISVCLAAGLLHVAGQLTTTTDDGQLLDIDLDLVNRWAFMAEKIFHGRPSGIDNTVCTFGGGVSYRSGTFDKIQMPSDLKILLVNSGVSRQTKEVVAAVRQKVEKFPNILNPILEAIDAISKQCISTLGDMNQVNNSDHSYTVLQTLIKLNHGLLRTLDVSHPKLEEIMSTATRLSFDAKLTGAGAGGFAYVLLTPDKLHSVPKLKLEFEKQGFQCWEVVVGGKGVSIDSFNRT